MSRNGIPKTLRLMLALLLAVMLLAGITGISATTHYCHNQISGTAYFTDLGLQNPVSCGCTGDDLAAGENPDPVPTFSASPCCKNITTYKRIADHFTYTGYNLSLAVQDVLATIDEVFLMPGAQANSDIRPLGNSPPPHRWGRGLIVFIVQFRIPPAGSFC